MIKTNGHLGLKNAISIESPDYGKEVQPPLQKDSDVSHVDAQPFNSSGMALL